VSRPVGSVVGITLILRGVGGFLFSPDLGIPIIAPVAAPKHDEICRLVHALREPVGAFSIHLTLLDDGKLSENGHKQLDAMLGNVERMAAALSDITKAFGLETVNSTPLAILSRD